MSENKEKKSLHEAEGVKGAHPSGLRKKALWTIVFIAIAVLTVWAITSQNKSFSFTAFLAFLKGLNPIWIIAAVLAMVAYIVFEGMAILTLCKSLGFRRSFGKGYSYSAADIYFSAITPSSTGGQPASAFFMMKDGIPGSATTAILLTNLIMYTLSIMVLGIASFAVTPWMFGYFSTASQVLILVGIGVQVGIVALFLLLLKKASFIRWLGCNLIFLLAKLRLIRRRERKLARLNRAIDSYENTVTQLGKHRGALAKTFLYNLLQRTALVAVSVFTYLAAGGSTSHLHEFFGAQCMVILAYSFIPVPGAMGVADALLLDVLCSFLGSAQFAANLELLSRSISFYLCVFLCGISFLVRCILISKRKTTEDAPAQISQENNTNN